MALGITHADYFYGEIPCTRRMTAEEIQGDYEKEPGMVIKETNSDKDPHSMPVVLVRSHGSFTWGYDPKDAVQNAVVLEEVAFINYHAQMLMPDLFPMRRN